MNSRPTIQQELKDLSSFLPHDIEQPVFTVPNGYFENFAASVWQKLRSQQLQTPHDELTELSAMLAAIPKKNPYTVPENYFSGFAPIVPSLVKEEDELPEALLATSRQMPNTVPAGYFDGLADTVLAKVTKPTAKVVSFNKSRFMRMAAAAVVIGIVAISSIVYFNTNEQTIDPNQQSGEWVAKSLQNVSNQALDEFIMTTDIGYQASNTQNGNTNDVKHMLEGVSTSELDAFLEAIPAGNEETLIN
jgi:hypothetical protein